MEKLAVIHNLGRSGGTLVAKVVGCMDEIVLLSEIHPKGSAVILNYYGQSKLDLALLLHSIVQAKDWHGIRLNRSETEIKLTPEGDEFLLYIEEIYDSVRENHQFLVIRDWCYLDYIGVPFCEPTYVNHLNQILKEKFLLNHVYILRHPIDHLISCAKATRVQFSLEKYLYGYLSYIKSASVDQLVKYEDFVDAPDATLRKIVQMLDIPYDPAWRGKWSQYRKVTGDMPTVLTTQEATEAAIKRRPRSPVAPKVLEAFERSSTYQEILALTGYGHPF
ncbi:sulfotransferase [Trichothermofontia sichuanensis B231]|uniref:hypothetical protein n=1 Tax=Trichothermofontia sichuanensis TaxID=3045816 RepID=UPI002245DC0A|nr:hypothetical protein [Trichothermofontia sichuanensis]UZQ53933.1 sulfotransferase [Trichothermofontia sichuanensis B231]